MGTVSAAYLADAGNDVVAVDADTVAVDAIEGVRDRSGTVAAYDSIASPNMREGFSELEYADSVRAALDGPSRRWS